MWQQILFILGIVGLLLSGLVVASSPAPATATVAPINPDDPGRGAFATGTYRNLFVEILGKTQQQSDARMRAFDQLFHGDLQTQGLYTPAGKNEHGPLAYIPDIQHTDVRSEGMSYGMMISVELNKKEEFDALWNWSMTFMYHDDPRHPACGYFSWQMNYDGTAISELPAPDGEEYYAMALLFASNRWGNSTAGGGGGGGIYDYKAQAHKLLHNMVHRENIAGVASSAGRKIAVPRIPADPYQTVPIVLGTQPATAASAPTSAPAAAGGPAGPGFSRGPRTTTIGKEVNPDRHMILFSPDERSNFTDPSYHLPAFYELWARWGNPGDRDFWLQAAAASRDLFIKAANPQTGLLPNFCNFDGTPNRGAPVFREDAWHCAMNWSVDWSWFARDPRQQELSDRLQSFFESKGMDTYDDNWNLDGTSIRNRHSPGLVATNGAASIAAADRLRQKKFLEALWNLDVPSSLVFRYYDGLLYTMCLMHCSGDFKIIMPQK